MISASRAILAAAGLLAATTRPLLCASLTERAPPLSLQKDVRCMVETLKTMPEIDSVTSSVARYGGVPRAMVQYRDRSKAGLGTTVRFEVLGSEPPFDFQTVMRGLTTPGSAPSDFGARMVENAWKSRCKVNAYTLFE